MGAAVVYSAYILVSDGVARRLAPRLLAALVCTGAAVTLGAGAALAGDLRPGALTAAGWGWIACLAAVSTVAAIGAVLRGPAPGRADERVDPVHGRAARDRGPGLPGLRRDARRAPARRWHPGSGGGDREDDGMIALVAGATRGAGRGIAVALGEAGATVYCTGRSTRERRSEYDRPETIEETAELVTEAGGQGIAVAVDHLETGAGRGAGGADRRRAGAARPARQRRLGRREPVRVQLADLGARPRNGLRMLRLRSTRT